jgi:uncharacterized iron-regulated protein
MPYVQRVKPARAPFVVPALLAGMLAVLACAGLRGAGSPESGAIWDVHAERVITADDLFGALAARRLILLGEKHDSAEHHRLQARILDALVRAGRRPAVAFEMLPADVGPALAEALGADEVTPADVAAAVAWDESGWPDFALYEPAVAAALAAGLPLVAADLSRSDRQTLREAGISGLPSERVTRLALDEPLTAAQRSALEDGIREAHCGYAPEAHLPRMVELQRARDAALADAMLLAADPHGVDGAVLIAGAGHARRDLGVPVYLARRGVGAEVASVALLEIDLEGAEPGDALAELFGGRPPYDYVWLTPLVDREDPCERFAEQLERMREGAHTPPIDPNADTP